MRLLQVFIMSLLVLLPSSSFFLSGYLSQLITDKDHNQAQLSYALDKKNLAALNFSVQHELLGSNRWLSWTAELAKNQGESAYLLGAWYVKKSKQTASLERSDAARNKAKMWFKQAMRLESPQAAANAQLALATLHFKQNDFVAAQLIIKDFNSNLLNDNVDVLILQLNTAISLGQTAFVAEKLKEKKHILLGTVKGRLLLDDILRFKVISSLQNKNQSTQETKEKTDKAVCSSSLQLFATSLKHLKHLEQLQKSFRDKPLSRFICLAGPRYLAVDTLNCSNDSEKAIQCNESIWQGLARSIESRHIGLMVEKGGANVHLGIMYFDSQDTVDVFSHEISHLLGFVDEYPLIKSHEKCQQTQPQQFSHNIAVLNTLYYGDRNEVRTQILKDIPWAKHISNETPILQKVSSRNNAWRLGTPDDGEKRVGAFVAESCNNSLTENEVNFSAYKPISRRTHLRYFASEFPAEYLTLLSDQPNRFAMPSFHYNLALAAYKQGFIVEAKDWLKQAAIWEKNPERRKKIIQGAF